MIRILPLALGLIVTGCATSPAPVAPATATETPTPAQQAPVQAEAAPTPEAPATIEPDPIVVDLTRLENQTPTEVIGYLGTPSLVRRDDTVQVMIFETGTCVVEIIFYEPVNGDHFRSRRINTRSPSGQDVDTENCVRRQLELAP